MVVFTIDVVRLVLLTHRLQKDGSFREVERGNPEIQENDLIFHSYSQANRWVNEHPVVEIGDLRIETRGAHTLGSPSLHIRQHRTAKPKKSFFTKSEVEEVLRKGNDDVYSSLVVDYDGNVHLVPTMSDSREGYAVRIEGFQPGAGYVGPNSQLNHLNHTYKVLLEAWIVHLQTGDNEYRDYSDGRRTVEELQKEAERLVSEMEF